MKAAVDVDNFVLVVNIITTIFVKQKAGSQLKNKEMTNSNFQIGQEVVRTMGDYVVGRIGSVIAIDSEKNRAQVKWVGETTTWVSFKALALTSIPYEITPGYDDKKKGKFIYPKYRVTL